jgi:hypothetical protein
MLKQINSNLSKVYPECEYVKSMTNLADMVEMRLEAAAKEYSDMEEHR